jgi:hypothetical protein
MGQDYRLKKLYEQIYSDKKAETSNNKFKSANSLQQSYDLVNNPKNRPSVEDFSALEKITGISDKQNLNVLYKIYEFLIQNNSFKTADIAISVGSPKERAYKPDINLTYSALEGILLEVVSNSSKKLVVTYASRERKIRTPYGVRIGQWSAITPDAVNSCANDLSQSNTTNVLIKVFKKLRCLIVFHLYKMHSNDIDFKVKLPPGIGQELAQVDEFNKALKGTSSLNLFLPEDTEPVPDVVFNGAKKIEGTGKADLALTNNGEQTFWISFKEGSHVPSDSEDKASVGFQQWGSLSSLYSTDDSIRWSVDLFLTKCLDQHKENFISFNTKTQSDLILKALNEHQITNQAAVKKAIEKVSAVHIQLEKTAMFFKLFESGITEKQNKLQETMSLALKAIYGSKFEYNKSTPFSSENVNIIIETPTPLTFTPVLNDNEDITAMRLVLVPGSHIIKNPDLPDSGPYLPCLYIRRTAEERFMFRNFNTNNQELIVGGRLLVYPVGRTKTADEVAYSPASFKRLNK